MKETAVKLERLVRDFPLTRGLYVQFVDEVMSQLRTVTKGEKTNHSTGLGLKSCVRLPLAIWCPRIPDPRVLGPFLGDLNCGPQGSFERCGWLQGC